MTLTGFCQCGVCDNAEECFCDDCQEVFCPEHIDNHNCPQKGQRIIE